MLTKRYILAGLASLVLAGCAHLAPVSQPAAPGRFAPEIAHFADLDRATPPAPCRYLFVGSSSIRFWSSLATDMAPYSVINRGFGGSTIADVNGYFDQVVTPYRPRAIFFYAGENDLWAKAPPRQVVADFRTFMALKRQKLGATKVYFISLKPSKQRFAQFAEQSWVNRRIRTMAALHGDLGYVDVVPVMLEAGQPKDIFIADGLHMVPAGYGLWTSAVRPVLEAEAKAGRKCEA